MPRIQHKRGTSANLASVNPTPLAGELVWDSTENAIKIGDGATAWTSLAYVTATPRTHTHSADAITSGTIDYARLPVGSTSSTVCAGDDARLSDARTPTAHKASHATGGSDALTPADIGAAPAASPAFTGNATFSASSGVPVTITNTGSGNSFVVNDEASDASPFVVGSSGMVGIGAEPTSRRLTVRGSSTGDGAVLLQSSSTGTGTSNGFIIQCFGATSDAYVWNFENAPIIFGANNAERMRLTAAGDLGLGPSRTAPASRLDVNGVITVSATAGSAGSYAPSLTFSGDANTGFGQVSGQSDTASVFTAGHERVRVDASGRVGIGTTASSFDQVVSAPHAVIGNGTSASGVTIYSGTGVSGSLAFADGTTTTDQYRGLLAYTHSIDAMRFFTAATERVRIDSSGQVGIGTTSPSALLDINADKIRLRTAKTPASASDTGNAGDICWDASYLYICTATNTWRRIAHSTW